MKLVWTRPAHQDRKAIREYIAADNPIAAIDLDTLFSQKAAYLIDHPGLGRPGRVPGTRELVVHRNYILIYDVVDVQVRVLRVLHAARMWPPGP
ncbi:hypothetical protein os1_10330 [Comamonadaceae bacterium OS-1]|nr:hypothetical protein os1_10330 [Comamonadaceae bacterium OS-1]